MTKQESAPVIVIHETVLKSWLRDASTFTVFVALIGVGVVLGSSAMQWIGAIIAFIVIAAKSTGHHKNIRKTIAEARTFLDELEKRA